MITLIAAIGPNRELGLDNQLIYHSKEDMAFFREMTEGKAVLMGSNTFRSIGHSLPNRRNFVATHHPESLPNTVEPITNIKNFIRDNRSSVKNSLDLFVIGGAQIYSQAINYAEEIYLTEFDEPKEADAFFPKFNQVFFDKKKVRDIPGGAIFKYTFHPWKIKPNYVLL